ncbi:hypothetical protein DFH09DRAFT_1406700 [Mycena vulgaris]|nr:hypothetical protein DFH09DRAFT_1406700 [Mycena vulgaris]
MSEAVFDTILPAKTEIDGKPLSCSFRLKFACVWGSQWTMSSPDVETRSSASVADFLTSFESHRKSVPLYTVALHHIHVAEKSTVDWLRSQITQHVISGHCTQFSHSHPLISLSDAATFPDCVDKHRSFAKRLKLIRELSETSENMGDVIMEASQAADTYNLKQALSIPNHIAERQIGDNYPPAKLPDHPGPYFAHEKGLLVQRDYRYTDGSLIAPHELYDKLTEGTPVLAMISLSTYWFISGSGPCCSSTLPNFIRCNVAAVSSDPMANPN